jgi:hypothetical protein
MRSLPDLRQRGGGATRFWNRNFLLPRLYPVEMHCTSQEPPIVPHRPQGGQDAQLTRTQSHKNIASGTADACIRINPWAMDIG